MNAIVEASVSEVVGRAVSGEACFGATLAKCRVPDRVRGRRDRGRWGGTVGLWDWNWFR